MLPEDVIIEVLLRLSMKSIIQCKSVCKRWRHIISDPYFVNLHMSTSPECPLIHVANKLDSPGILKWVEQMEHVSSLDLTRCAPRATSTFSCFGSVNGLVSCGDPYSSILYILNPVLNEFMALPRPKNAKSMLGYGFGVSSTDEYEVVRISCQDNVSFETEVYTLGTDRWKSLGLTPFNVNLIELVCTGLYLNSHLYWELCDDHNYDLDLTTETFELFPLPRVHTGLNKKLGVLKGRICCIVWSKPSGLLEIWVMKEGSWYKEINIKENIMSFFRGGMWTPACVITGLKGTSNLLVYDQRKVHQLVVYCIDTNTFRPLELHGYFLKIIQYRPTFLSLHNFGSARVHAMM